MRYSAAMTADRDRVTAARVLVRVEQGAWASRVLAGAPWPGVRVRVLGVLRWLRLLDAELGRFSSRPLERFDAEVRAALRIGLFEATELGVPPPVAVDAAVRAVRRLGRGAAAGLVNAVLRKAVAADRAAWLAGLGEALRLAHPDWLARRWREHLGDAGAAAMAADQQPAGLWVWFTDPARPAALAAAGLELAVHPWCPGAWTCRSEPRQLLAEVGAGRAVVQDPSSQLVAHLAARLAPAGGRFIDLCAAPGGKTALVGRLAAPATVVASDRQLGRTRRLVADGRLAAGGLAVVADAARPPFTASAWDLVLVDAPCSGTGTLCRHPELKWSLDEAAIERCAAIQDAILAGACELVAVGGVLLYSTCSVEPEENEALLARLPAGFERAAVADLLPAGVAVQPTAADGVVILPSAFGDGFSMHAIRRAAR